MAVRAVPLVAGAVVLRPPPTEGLAEDASLANHEPTDVVRLEEPFVGVDRDGLRPLEVGNATRVAGRQPRRGAVRRVHVQPQVFALGNVGKLADGVHGAGVRRARDRGDRDRQEARRAVAPDRFLDRRRPESEVVTSRHDGERLGREPELVQRAPDREVRLVGGVDADALEGAATRPAARLGRGTGARRERAPSR